MVKGSTIKSIILLSISSILLLVNIFYKQFISEYTVLLFLAIILVITVFLFGLEKSRIVQKRKVLTSIAIFTIAFTIMIYGVGLIIGFAKTSYDLSFLGIVKNLIPLFLWIGISELLRFNIIKKTDKNIWVLLLTILLFTLVDASLVLHLYKLNNLEHVFELMTVIAIPSIAKNYVLCDMTDKYGMESCIIYQVLTNVLLYILPFVPSYGPYLDSVFNFLQPLSIWFIINLIYQKENVEDVRKKHLPYRIVTSIFIVFIVLIVALYSNIFRYWIAVVGSGSMSPTIEVGDAIIIDKSYSKHPEKLVSGYILVFKVHDVIYTHRIVKIDKTNGKYSIATRGDRKGQAKDTWKVTEEDIVGVVKYKIPFIGRPSVWLNRIMEGRKK